MNIISFCSRSLSPLPSVNHSAKIFIGIRVLRACSGRAERCVSDNQDRTVREMHKAITSLPPRRTKRITLTYRRHLTEEENRREEKDRGEQSRCSCRVIAFLPLQNFPLWKLPSLSRGEGGVQTHTLTHSEADLNKVLDLSRSDISMRTQLAPWMHACYRLRRA